MDINLPNKRWMGAAFALMLSVAPFQGAMAQVTLSTPNTTLGTVIKKIQAQKKYQFFYDDKLTHIPVAGINVKNEAIEKVMELLLKGKGVSYKIEDNVVYLKKEGPQTPQTNKTTEKRKISGQVLDENQEPMIGVTVTP